MRRGHPEKDGVLIEMVNLEQEVKDRIGRRGEAGWLMEGVNGMSLDEAVRVAPKTG